MEKESGLYKCPYFASERSFNIGIDEKKIDIKKLLKLCLVPKLIRKEKNIFKKWFSHIYLFIYYKRYKKLTIIKIN